MTGLDAAQEAAYREAEYVVYEDDEAIITRIGQPCARLAQLLALRGARCAVLLNACNPRSQALSIGENFSRQQLLSNELKGLQLSWLSAVGRSADGLWQEVSMLAFDLSLDQAQHLCQQFEQHAWVSYDSEGRGELMVTDLSGVPNSTLKPSRGRKQ